ncbi:hypothetical protein EJB05_32405, partial [Eragrostis curvula]
MRTHLIGRPVTGWAIAHVLTESTLFSETWSKLKLGMHTAKQSEEKLKYFHKCVSDAVEHMLNMGSSSEKSMVQEFESFIGTTIPDEISIYPPEVAHTKGNGRRLKRGSEQASSKKTKKKAKKD